MPEPKREFLTATQLAKGKGRNVPINVYVFTVVYVIV